MLDLMHLRYFAQVFEKVGNIPGGAATLIVTVPGSEDKQNKDPFARLVAFYPLGPTAEGGNLTLSDIQSEDVQPRSASTADIRSHGGGDLTPSPRSQAGRLKL